MNEPQLPQWKITASLACLALLFFVSSASAAVLFTDNFTLPPGGVNNQDVNQGIAQGSRQSGPLASVSSGFFSTYTFDGGQHQIGNTTTDLGQPVVSDGGYILLAGGRFQSDLDITKVSTGPLTIQFDMYNNGARGGSSDQTEWAAFALRSPGNTFPIAGAGEFGILMRANGGLQVFQNGVAISDSAHNNAGTTTNGTYIFTFSDTAGTGSAFVGNGSQVTISNVPTGTSYILTLSQLSSSNLRFGFQNDNRYAGIDNLIISGTLPAAPAQPVLFHDNFAAFYGLNGDGNLNLNVDLTNRQSGLQALMTWTHNSSQCQLGNAGTGVNQPFGGPNFQYVLLSNGGFQSDLDIAAASATTLTVEFDIYQSSGSWTAMSLRAPGSAAPTTLAAGEFSFLQQPNGGLQLWDGVGSITPSGWNNAGFAPAQHWKLIFADTNGTGSAFVGNGSKITMINGTSWTNTIFIHQLNRSGLELGFNESGGLGGIDNVTVWGTPSPLAVAKSTQSGTSPFTNTWTAETPNILTAGQLPTDSSGNFRDGLPGTSVLTDGAIGISGNTNGFASCGANDGTSLIYTLTGSPNGYDLTNLVTYSGWGDGGRFGQYYDVSYSTVTHPTVFIPLGTVFYLCGNVNGAPASRVAMAMTNGAAMASGVGRIKFNFSSPPNASSFNNGWQGYSEIIVQGTNTTTLSVLLTQDILPAAAVTYVGDQITFSATYSNSPPVATHWQQITAGPVTNNLSTGVVNVTNNNAVTSTLTINNVQTTNSGTYALEGLNATNGAAAPVFTTGAPLTVSALPAPVNNIVVGISGQFGLGEATSVNASTNFYPTWTENTASDLILGSSDGGPNAPGTVYAGSGNFAVNTPNPSNCNGDPAILSDGSFGYQNYFPNVGGNQTLDSVGNSGGQSVTYTLPASSSTGWSLTNITVVGGWGDGGRDEQKYEVLYSTISAQTVFNHLISVDYNPVGVPANTQSAVRTILNPASGAMAQNVYAIEFNFNNAGSPPENNWVGLSEIVVAGQPSPPIPVITSATTPSTAEDVVGSSLTLTAGFSGATSYQWLQNGTNLGVNSPTLTLSNLQLTNAGVYQVLAINPSGTNSSATTCTVYVDPAPTPAGNITTSVAYQTDNANGFTPTWDTSHLANSLIYLQNPPLIGYDTNDSFTELDAFSNSVDGGLPVLTDGDYGIFDNSAATHPAFADCGDAPAVINPGEYVIYQLGNGSPAANGYDVTNIQIAGGWNDNGRDSQYYTVMYATTANPTMFYPLAAVANRLDHLNSFGGGNGEAVPSGSGIQTTVRTTFTPVAGVLASNVAAIKVNFQFPAGVPNGWSGYSDISVYGSPSAAAAPAGPVITTADEFTNNIWTAEKPNLIAYYQPSSSTGLFITGGEGCTTPGFTDGVLSFGGNYNVGPGGTDTNYSYQTITYSCTNVGGWNLTNIVTYSMWHDFGRAGQFYNLSYSTTSAPSVFLPLASVAYAPFVPNNGQAAGNRVQISPAIGQTLLASNVAAVRFDFTPEGSQNFGWSGYSELILQGTNANGTVTPPPNFVYNPSFELDVTPIGIAGATTAWTTYNSPSAHGSEHADGGDYTVTNPLAATADGKQFLFVNNTAVGVTAGVYQDVGPLQTNTTYTLTVAIGSRADRLNSPGTVSLINGIDNTGTVLATTNGIPATQNTWQDYTVTFTTGPVVSGDLTIALGALGAGTIQADFDNVRLTTAPPAALSTNAQLTSLALSPAGTLSPVFATGTTGYTATNTCANNPVTVTVINADLTATNWLVYNGTTNQLTSGTSSSPLTLVAGVNPVTVQVVSQDLSQTNNYTVAVALTAPPTVSVNSATIYVGGSATLTATTSASSPSYLWSDSETTPSITVSPAATTNYTVIVTDATTGCAGGGSGTVTVLLNTNALLATLSISPGTLSQTFISGTTNYTATNSYGQNPVTVTATSVDTNATLALSFTNGAYGTAVTKSLSVSGNNLGLNPPVNTVAVRVVSQDLSQTNVYTVNVLLQPSQTVPKLTNSVSGSTLNLSWAADHLGYTLLTQTNNLNKGVSSVASDWGPVAGSTTTNSMSITIIKTGVTNAYYRLVYP